MSPRKETLKDRTDVGEQAVGMPVRDSPSPHMIDDAWFQTIVPPVHKRKAFILLLAVIGSDIPFWLVAA